MEQDSFQRLLADRAQHAGVSLPRQLAERLERYYGLLSRWNTRINLTSLPVDVPSAHAIDRLLIEPITAAATVANVSIWFDLGSGGGSPAIPLQLAHPASRLVMVESRERKAAFLNEAIRKVPVDHAETFVGRIEDVAADPRNAGLADLVSVRAVRIDARLLSQIQTLLRFGGQALLFGASITEDALPRGLQRVPSGSGASFVMLTRTGI